MSRAIGLGQALLRKFCHFDWVWILLLGVFCLLVFHQISPLASWASISCLGLYHI